jgi:hypothetical protein
VAEADRFYPFLTQIRIELPVVVVVPMMMTPVMVTPAMMMPAVVVVPAMMAVAVMPVDRYGLETIDLVLRHDRGLSTCCARLHQSLIG